MASNIANMLTSQCL